MRYQISFLLLVFLSVWLLTVSFFTGNLTITELPENMAKLTLPSSYHDLGNAMATLDGLLASIAVVLGLVAVLMQGKELKASTDAQTQQAEALTQQIEQQQASNRLGAYSARLQFLSSEIEHMEIKIAEMVAKKDELQESGQKDDLSKQWDLIKNTRAKQSRFRKQAQEIDEKIQSLLDTFHF